VEPKTRFIEDTSTKLALAIINSQRPSADVLTSEIVEALKNEYPQMPRKRRSLIAHTTLWLLDAIDLSLCIRQEKIGLIHNKRIQELAQKKYEEIGDLEKIRKIANFAETLIHAYDLIDNTFPEGKIMTGKIVETLRGKVAFKESSLWIAAEIISDERKKTKKTGGEIIAFPVIVKNALTHDPVIHLSDRMLSIEDEVIARRKAEKKKKKIRRRNRNMST
jgi:hypothetical protein